MFKRTLFIAMTIVGTSLFGPRALCQQEAPPPPAASRKVNFPKSEEATLKNGLRVIVVRRSGVPLFTTQVLVKSGGEVDPPALAGLADMTASLLTEGTTTRTAPQIAEAIDSLGASIDSEARWDASIASVSGMSEKFEPAMEILADIVLRPAFKEEEIERLRQQSIDDLSVALRQPGTLARLVASRLVYGQTSYAHSLNGTPESLQRIKRDDIVQVHKKYYRPDNAILVIGGDMDPARAFKVAEQLFGKWEKPATPLSEQKAHVAKSDQSKIVVVDMPDAGQAAVLVARKGLMRSDPDYYTGMVANSVLGLGYSARLNQEIRIKRGLSYGAGSILDVRRDVGPFVAATQTKNESGAEVASLIVEEVKKLSKLGVPDTELTPRKAVLTGGFSRNIETVDGLVGQIASFALYGLNLQEINNYIDKIEAVSARQVQDFISRKLDPTEAHVVIVGNAKLFLEDLKKRFKSVEVIAYDQLDLNSPNLRRGSVSSR
jgi:zinc protease